MTWFGALLGLLGILIGVIAPPLVIWLLLARKERLIFGDRLFQVVVNKSGQEVVQLQIPYANIESISIQQENDQKVVAMQLRELDNPDTFSSDQNAFITRQRYGLSHFSIHDQYPESLNELCNKIKKRMLA